VNQDSMQSDLLSNIVITHQLDGLQVTLHGKPMRLAFVTDDGAVLASGPEVADLVEVAAVDGYRRRLDGLGLYRTLSPRQ
jgi:hypothetical protein